MIIQPNIKLQRSLTVKYWKETRKTLAKSRAAVLEMAENTDPDTLKLMTKNLLQSQPVVDQLVRIWGEVGGRFGYDMETLIKRNKKALGDSDLEDWKRRMRVYSSERSLLKAEKILNTEQEVINGVIDDVLKQSLDEGMGIPETRRLMRDMLSDELTKIEKYQAQRIAMTEVGGASNTASFEAAHESGTNARKIWMFIPGRKTFRENHRQFEADGPKPMDYEYAPGLKHPGDSNAAAEEIISCYCTIGYEVD